jgi:hypothetical protein
MLALLGLQDPYGHDGRAIIEPLHDWALPHALREHQETLSRLGAVYKQVNAAFGRFAMDALAASTEALKSGSSADDGAYARIQNRIQSLTDERDELASQMKAVLDAAAFGGQEISRRHAERLIDQGEELLEQARHLARR